MNKQSLGDRGQSSENSPLSIFKPPKFKQAKFKTKLEGVGRSHVRRKTLTFKLLKFYKRPPGPPRIVIVQERGAGAAVGPLVKGHVSTSVIRG
jgi:hypothetical protein